MLAVTYTSFLSIAIVLFPVACHAKVIPPTGTSVRARGVCIGLWVTFINNRGKIRKRRAAVLTAGDGDLDSCPPPTPRRWLMYDNRSYT